jgi:hypothetical protein
MLGDGKNKICTHNDFQDIQERFKENYFDIILSHGGFHHIVETDTDGNILENESYNRQKEIMNRLISMLKPNGFLVIADIPNKDFSENLGIFSNNSLLLSDFIQIIDNNKIEKIKNFLQISDIEKITLTTIKHKIEDVIKGTKVNPVPRHFFDEYISKNTTLGHTANYPDFDLIENWTNGLAKKESQINFDSPWLFKSKKNANWFFQEKFSIENESDLSEEEFENNFFNELTEFLGTGNHNGFTFVNWGVTYAIYRKNEY